MTVTRTTTVVVNYTTFTPKLMGGGVIHSNVGYRDTFLKTVSLLENYRSEWGKSIHFWKAL